MNVLIIGNGAREHAFVVAISKSRSHVRVFSINANCGLLFFSEDINVDISDFSNVKEIILDKSIDMVLVGPEMPLINGITDFINSDPELKHVNVIGPSKQGAMLEGSKEFAKNFMNKYGIPTAYYKSFDSLTISEGIDFIKNNNPPFVLKADGPAAGKGVLIVDNEEEAIKNLEDMILNSKFGKSSEKVVIEEFLDGIEMSCFVLFDGLNYKILPYAKDYKRIGEGDKGLNTGGMGAISPVNFLDDNLKNKIKTEIVEPTINGLINEKINYVGFIFIGLINVDGQPKVIEYNVRMGDPETQVVLPRIKTDFVDLLKACINNKLSQIDLELDSDYFVNVVIASKGYPEKYEKGHEITFEDDTTDSVIYHAGTTSGPRGSIVTNGGRVLSVVSRGKTMDEALKKSYESIDKINFKGKTFRKDIGFDL
mgnify:CR=1 FL=1